MDPGIVTIVSAGAAWNVVESFEHTDEWDWTPNVGENTQFCNISIHLNKINKNSRKIIMMDLKRILTRKVMGVSVLIKKYKKQIKNKMA